MKTAIALACALTLSACANVPQSPGSDAVRILTADQARACTLVKPVTFAESQVATVGKSPWLWQRLTEQGLKNAAAAAGGNAVTLTKDEGNWFVGTLNATGDAYRCAA
jgi:hypothetical protein